MQPSFGISPAQTQQSPAILAPQRPGLARLAHLLGNTSAQTL
jgi:hypothetical protein